MQWYTACDDDVRARYDASGSCSGNRSTHYENFGTGGHAAYQTPEFEYKESAEESPFYVKHAVEASVCW